MVGWKVMEKGGAWPGKEKLLVGWNEQSKVGKATDRSVPRMRTPFQVQHPTVLAPRKFSCFSSFKQFCFYSSTTVLSE